MAFLNEHVSEVFQNLSSPMPMNEEMVFNTQTVRTASPNKTLVTSLNSAVANFMSRQVESLASTASTKTAWLNRKASFKQVAKKSIRSISVTNMAGTPGTKSKSPQTHRRNSSVKSAKAAVCRKNTSSTNLGLMNVETEKQRSSPRRVRASNSFNMGTKSKSSLSNASGDCLADSKNSSNSSFTSQDVVSYGSSSAGVPNLESVNAKFDLSYDDSIPDDDEFVGFDNDGDVDEPPEGDGEGSVYSESSSPTRVKEYFPPIQKMNEEKQLEDIPPPIFVHDEECAYDEETKWAQEAIKMRMDKGRTDSMCTNEVTYINTILNKNLNMTNEGDEIRRKMKVNEPAISPTFKIVRQTSEEGSTTVSGSILETPEPPILTIEPPSPMPMQSSRISHRTSYSSDTQYRTTSGSDEENFEHPTIPEPSQLPQGEIPVGVSYVEVPTTTTSSGPNTTTALKCFNTKTKCAARRKARYSSSFNSGSSTMRDRKTSNVINENNVVKFRTSYSEPPDLRKKTEDVNRNSESSDTNISDTENTNINTNPFPSTVHRSNENILSNSTSNSRHASGEKEHDTFSPKGMYAMGSSLFFLFSKADLTYFFGSFQCQHLQQL